MKNKTGLIMKELKVKLNKYEHIYRSLNEKNNIMSICLNEFQKNSFIEINQLNNINETQMTELSNSQNNANNDMDIKEDSNKVYLFEQGYVVCLDQQTGNVLWKYNSLIRDYFVYSQ